MPNYENTFTSWKINGRVYMNCSNAGKVLCAAEGPHLAAELPFLPAVGQSKEIKHNSISKYTCRHVYERTSNVYSCNKLIQKS